MNVFWACFFVLLPIWMSFLTIYTKVGLVKQSLTLLLVFVPMRLGKLFLKLEFQDID